jgi:hypothetical protein
MADKANNKGSSDADRQERSQSTIQFPYGDLDDAISVAKALMSCGGVPCDADQLAGAMNQTPSSGNFRMKIAAARTFGVIETIQGKYQLTELGFAITDAGRERAARADAFLKVPLYKRVYEEFRNRQLPPRPLPLEHAFVGFGVAATQKERARQAFDRSAQQAGFFDQGGRDRLIRPPLATTASPTAAEQSERPPSENAPPPERPLRNGSSGGGGQYHPFIQGLLQSLPEPGTVWAIEGRAAWVKAAIQNFTLMYQGDGTIDVQVAPPKLDKAA